MAGLWNKYSFCWHLQLTPFYIKTNLRENRLFAARWTKRALRMLKITLKSWQDFKFMSWWACELMSLWAYELVSWWACELISLCVDKFVSWLALCCATFCDTATSRKSMVLVLSTKVESVVTFCPCNETQLNTKPIVRKRYNIINAKNNNSQALLHAAKLTFSAELTNQPAIFHSLTP